MKRIDIVAAVLSSAVIAFLIGALVGQHLVTVKSEERVRLLTDEWSATVTEREQHIERCQATIAELQKWSTAHNAATTPVAAKGQSDDFYTVLYEPGPPPQGQTAFEVIDALRPGLGRALSKLQAASATPGTTVHWVLIGRNVQVVAGPPNSVIGSTSIQSVRDGWIANPVPGQSQP